jgi:hypothetical protein
MREHRCSRQQANGLLFHGEPRATPEIPSSRNSPVAVRGRPCDDLRNQCRWSSANQRRAAWRRRLMSSFSTTSRRATSGPTARSRPANVHLGGALQFLRERPSHALDTRRGHVRGTGSNIPIFYCQRPEIFPVTSAGPAKSRGSIPERTGHRTLLRCGAAYPSADHDCGTGELRICHRHQRATSLRRGRHRASCGRHARLLLLGLALEKLDIHFRAVHPD